MNAVETAPVMASAVAASSRRAWARAAWVAVVLALASAAGELLAGAGYRSGWWGLGAGFKTLRWSATAAAVVLVLALLAAALAYRRRRLRSVAIFLGAALVGFVSVAPPAFLLMQAKRLPAIHDISTDTVDPPRFVAILPLRRDAANSTEYDSAVALQQQRAYPDVAPALLDVAAAPALARAERVARALGWEIVAVDRAELRIEATATTLLFGFKDDIVIRVTPEGAGSRVDVRSLSRVGGSDIGTNAKRIRAFIARLRTDATV